MKDEHGNSLKLTCCEDELGEKRLIGQGSTKVVETGADGMWVPITDERRVRAVRSSSCARTPREYPGLRFGAEVVLGGDAGWSERCGRKLYVENVI